MDAVNLPRPAWMTEDLVLLEEQGRRFMQTEFVPQLDKWHDASGLCNERGEPISRVDLDPHYERVERRLGVRERTDWRKSVRTVEPAFRALGAPLEAVHSYTDANCMSCGSCLQGCPTNAGKSTMNTYIHDAWAAGRLEVRANAYVENVVVEDGEATGVVYVDEDSDAEIELAVAAP